MILLTTKNLDSSVKDKLDKLQVKVDAELQFKEKAEKAKKLWNTKGGKAGKIAFKEIKKTLVNMTIFEGICNYCEQSEANDIEHIDPKSFFPERAFVWDNYLLACKQCNTGEKLDKCDVLDDNDDLVALVRGNEPPFKRIAFINPRIEDPNTFMFLNLETFKFDLLPELTKKDKNKFKSTLNILKLNERDVLIKARNSSAQHYFEKLDRLVRIIDATTKNELKTLLNPTVGDRFDFNKTLVDLKSEILESHKKYISTYQHPSVWYSIKMIESKVNDQWKNLFQKLPEALTW